MQEIPKELQNRYEQTCYHKLVDAKMASWDQAWQSQNAFDAVRRELYQTVGWKRALVFEFEFCFQWAFPWLVLGLGVAIGVLVCSGRFG